jgi:hypothetical protein
MLDRMALGRDMSQSYISKRRPVGPFEFGRVANPNRDSSERYSENAENWSKNWTLYYRSRELRRASRNAPGGLFAKLLFWVPVSADVALWLWRENSFCTHFCLRGCEEMFLTQPSTCVTVRARHVTFTPFTPFRY